MCQLSKVNTLCDISNSPEREGKRETAESNTNSEMGKLAAVTGGELRLRAQI